MPCSHACEIDVKMFYLHVTTAKTFLILIRELFKGFFFIYYVDFYRHEARRRTLEQNSLSACRLFFDMIWTAGWCECFACVGKPVIARPKVVLPFDYDGLPCQRPAPAPAPAPAGLLTYAHTRVTVTSVTVVLFTVQPHSDKLLYSVFTPPQ